jgi:RimJ/RimL family protein N-acetyltransferase
VRRHKLQQPLQRDALRRIEGERLLLRQPQEGDLQAIHRYAADSRASRFLAWSPHRDLEETRQFLQRCIEAWAGEERLPWLITLDGAVMGMIEVKLQGRNAGVGYVIAPEAWGKGYATEALCAVSEALFRHSPVSAIWALCVTQNPASARVLEKCGFECEKLIPGYFPCPNLDGGKHDVWRYVRYRDGAV